jgi:hypothetical protein
MLRPLLKTTREAVTTLFRTLFGAMEPEQPARGTGGAIG